jgi:hypothetical protein
MSGRDLEPSDDRDRVTAEPPSQLVHQELGRILDGTIVGPSHLEVKTAVVVDRVLAGQ